MALTVVFTLESIEVLYTTELCSTHHSLCVRLVLPDLVLLLDLVDDVLQVDLARGGEDAHGQHRVLAHARVQDQLQLLALHLVEPLPGLVAALVGAESDLIIMTLLS